MPPNMTEKPLMHYFSTFGHVTNVTVVRDKTTGISRGFGFVSLLTVSSQHCNKM
jgi:RNA recognition motif-containing protein